MKGIVAGSARRRYENRDRPRDPLRATIGAIERAMYEAGARGMRIDWDGPGTVVVHTQTPDGGHIGGRATVADYDSTAIAIMHAGAACIRAVIEGRSA